MKNTNSDSFASINEYQYYKIPVFELVEYFKVHVPLTNITLSFTMTTQLFIIKINITLKRKTLKYSKTALITQLLKK